jgi:hypothetical protein
MSASATVTICSTTLMGIRCSDGTRSDATAAPMRKIAGAGTRTHLLIRFDSSATDTTAAAMSSVTPNCSMFSSTSLACDLPGASTWCSPRWSEEQPH